MSIGSSGRIVIEIDPKTKRNLYSALTKNGVTLKGWFLECAGKYMADPPIEKADIDSSVITESKN